MSNTELVDIVLRLKQFVLKNDAALAGVTPKNETVEQVYMHFYGKDLKHAISAIESAMEWKNSADNLTDLEKKVY